MYKFKKKVNKYNAYIFYTLFTHIKFDCWLICVVDASCYILKKNVMVLKLPALGLVNATHATYSSGTRTTIVSLYISSYMYVEFTITNK